MGNSDEDPDAIERVHCKTKVTAYFTCSKCGQKYCTPCSDEHDTEHKNGGESVDHPDHYGGKHNPYEAIKVMKAVLTDEEFRGLCKGTALKYIVRAGNKDPKKLKEDLDKAAWYLRYYTGAIE